MDGLNTLRIKLTKPQSFKDGEYFENYTRDVIFPEHIYNLIHKTQSYEQNTLDYSEDSKDPDYIFQPHDSKWRFHVECKYRNITKNNEEIQNIYNKYSITNPKAIAKDLSLKIDNEINQFSRIQIYKPAQFKRHKNIKENVFVCIGLFDDILDDITVFIIPINDMITHFIDLFTLDYYVVPNNYYIIPDKLRDLFINRKSAYCIRCGSSVNLNIIQPLCNNCWSQWYSHLNFKYPEKYCHSCKKTLSTSVAKPFCVDCYKSVLI